MLAIYVVYFHSDLSIHITLKSPNRTIKISHIHIVGNYSEYIYMHSYTNFFLVAVAISAIDKYGECRVVFIPFSVSSVVSFVSTH